MTSAGPYAITFTPAARRRLSNLPLSAATALYEHLTGPVAGNPRRLGKPLDAPFDEVLSTRRGDYRALYTVDDQARVVTGPVTGLADFETAVTDPQPLAITAVPGRCVADKR